MAAFEKADKSPAGLDPLAHLLKEVKVVGEKVKVVVMVVAEAEVEAEERQGGPLNVLFMGPTPRMDPLYHLNRSEVSSCRSCSWSRRET